MQLVADKYYYLYNRVLTGLGLVAVLAVIVAWTVPMAEPYREPLGLSIVTGVIACIQLAYGLLLFRREAVNSGPWMAGLFASLLITLNLINIIHNTGQLHSWFLIAWGIQTFISGMFGLYAVVGSCFLVTIYFVIIETGPAATNEPDLFSTSVVLGTYFIGVIGYALWKRLYIDQESQQIKHLTGQLKTKQQQAEIIIQSITDGMIVITPDSKISLMNPAAAKMTEWSVEEASGIDAHLVVKLFQEDGKDLSPDQDPFTEVFSTEQPVDKTLQLVGRNGKRITVSLIISPVIPQATQKMSGAVAILRDVSAARAEEQRRADFISTASHEMRTPVAAIEGYLALALNDKVSSIDSKARSYLDKAHASTQHLGKLFQDLLTSAKAEDGRLVNNPVVIEMGNYLEQLTESLQFTAEKKGLLMDFVIGASGSGSGGGKVIKPLYYVHADPDRLREVITNLFDNGVKYTETGKISIGLTGNNSVVQLYIRDTGPGIPEADVPHLFQKFYRVDNSATRTIGGTGLGLFICRKIIELYNGRIWVESEVGKGSTFYINLPRLTSQKAAELQAAEAAQTVTLATPGGNL